MGFTFSKHAIERYAERIQECSPAELAGFIALKSEEIKERITKMITYSELVYTGKSKNEYNKSIVDVYLHNDGWVVIVDHNTNNVITLYKICLGLDEEFDKMYVERILEKLGKIKEDRSIRLKEIEDSEEQYKSAIEENDRLIIELRTRLNQLEAVNEDLQKVIDDLTISRELADSDLKDMIAKLLGRKVF